MKRYLRLISDRQTLVLTVPALDFNSLHAGNLRKVGKLFRQTTEQTIGRIMILDVTAVKSAGAGFLTEVHRLASELANKDAQLVIAGELGGLFRLVGWERRFQLYDSLAAAVVALAEQCPSRCPGRPVQPGSSLATRANQCDSGACVC